VGRDASRRVCGPRFGSRAADKRGKGRGVKVSLADCRGVCSCTGATVFLEGVDAINAIRVVVCVCVCLFNCRGHAL